MSRTELNDAWCISPEPRLWQSLMILYFESEPAVPRPYLLGDEQVSSRSGALVVDLIDEERLKEGRTLFTSDLDVDAAALSLAWEMARAWVTDCFRRVLPRLCRMANAPPAAAFTGIATFQIYFSEGYDK